MGDFVKEMCDSHAGRVKEYREMITKRRSAVQKALEDKAAAKIARKLAREAKKKAEELAALKENIQKNFVDKAVVVDDILKQDITEVDGWQQKDKPLVTALGGFLGQLILVLNTVAKYYPQYDRPSKSVKSGLRSSLDSRPKSQISGKASNKEADGENAGDKSMLSGADGVSEI